MRTSVLIKNSQNRFKLHIKNIKNKTHLILEKLGYKNVELSILFVDDNTIRSLNKAYREKDKATDVLSFAQYADRSEILNLMAISDIPIILGDIVISTDTAKRQAEEASIPFEEECLQLIIHGILHLAGYNHEDGAGEKEISLMRKKEREINEWREKCYQGLT